MSPMERPFRVQGWWMGMVLVVLMGCGAGERSPFEQHFGNLTSPIRFLEQTGVVEGFVFVPTRSAPSVLLAASRQLIPGILISSSPTPPPGYMPLRGARVTIPGVGTVETDERGHYLFREVPPGPIVIRVEPPPELAEVIRPVEFTVELPVGGKVEGFVAAPPPGVPTPPPPPPTGTIFGFVKELASGQPIAGARVIFRDQVRITDDQGRYEFRDLPTTGALETLRVEAAGYTPFQDALILQPVAYQLADIFLLETPPETPTL